MNNLFHFLQRGRRDLLLDSTIEDYSHLRRNRREPNRCQGSMIGHNVIDHDSQTGHDNLVRDYFASTPTYSNKQFRRRFQMSRKLFIRIHDGVVMYDNYFVQARNATKKLGLSSLQKVIVAVKLLATGGSADELDEYVRIAESTTNEDLKRFCEAVIVVFGENYLKPQNAADISRLLLLHEERGFPGMLGSIDCIHWTWKNCPTAWKGHDTGHCKAPTVVLEAVASRDLWIWHAFFGHPGSLNDLNVLDRSPVFTNLINGRAPPVNFVINGNQYDMGYYLGDGIYLKWSTIVKTIPLPQTAKHKIFAEAQEGARKDVERAFGVLQARFDMISRPCRFYKISTMKNIMKACIILHNMIIEEERDLYKLLSTLPELERSNDNDDYTNFIQGRQKLKDRTIHRNLQRDLIEHLWERHGNQL